jgi:hypothetical protein
LGEKLGNLLAHACLGRRADCRPESNQLQLRVDTPMADAQSIAFGQPRPEASTGRGTLNGTAAVQSSVKEMDSVRRSRPEWRVIRTAPANWL